MAKTPGFDLTTMFSDPAHFTDTEVADPVLGLAEQIARLEFLDDNISASEGTSKAIDCLLRVLEAETALRVARLEKELLAFKPAPLMVPKGVTVLHIPDKKE